MAELEKAYIVEVRPGKLALEQPPRIPVQFNPTTLKLQITANMAAGTPSGAQVRQATGPPSSTLTLDLVFDTADEGDTESPRSVREKTLQVERFLFPKGQRESEQKPPMIRFHWGHFKIDGVVDSLTVDMDHFAANGTPLRAKVSLAIREQKSKLIFLPEATGSLTAPLPGQPSFGTPGSAGGSADQVTAALGDESLPDLAARVGLDPSAWRGLSTDRSGGLSGDLSLPAGVEVGFSATLNASAGLGVSLGVEAGVSASLAASFGLEANAGISAVTGVGVGADLAAGFALSASGGVGAALDAVAIGATRAAEQQTRQAFAAPAAATPAPQPSAPEQPRAPLQITGIPSPTAQQDAPPAPPLPRVDARAASFGFGVPLRSTVGEAATARAVSLVGGGAPRTRTGDGMPPTTNNPTVPPWVALPNVLQKQRRPALPCGCAGRCRGGH